MTNILAVLRVLNLLEHDADRVSLTNLSIYAAGLTMLVAILTGQDPISVATTVAAVLAAFGNYIHKRAATTTTLINTSAADTIRSEVEAWQASVEQRLKETNQRVELAHKGLGQRRP